MRVKLGFAVLLLFLVSGCVDLQCEDYRRLDLGGWPVKAEVRIGQKPLGLTDLPRLKETFGVIYDFEKFDTHFITMEGANAIVDIIWLDATYRVVTISKNALPCPRERYCLHAPDLPVQHVLITSGGFTDRHSIEKGEKFQVVESCTTLDNLAKSIQK